MTDLAKLVVSLEAEIGKYQQGLDAANNKLKKFSHDQNKLLEGLQEKIIEFFAAKELLEWGVRIIENADHLNKLSESAGVSVEALSKLQFGLKLSGVEGDAAGAIFKKLNNAISEAAGNAKSDAGVAFAALGISLKDAAGNTKSLDTITGELADKFQTYADGPNKVAIALALMGRAGEQAIPFLNKGSEGIRELGDEAERAGAVIGADFARKAEAFNDKLLVLKTTLIDGIGNRIAAELLPNLSKMVDGFQNTADGVNALDHASEVGAAAIKVFASAGLVVANIFDEVGDTIGAAGASVVAFLHGHFAEAVSIANDNSERIRKSDDDLKKNIVSLWTEGGAALEEYSVLSKKVQTEAPNLAAIKLAAEAAAAALKQLADLKDSLAEEVNTFGLGTAAATKYRLEHGKLADDVKAAGAAGRKAAGDIEALADKLQALADNKKIEEGMKGIQSQIEAFAGDSATAKVLAFDKANKDLIDTLNRSHTAQADADKQQIADLENLIKAQGEYNDLQKQAADIQSDLAIQEERIRNSQAVGATDDLTALKELDDARTAASASLTDIYNKEKAISDANKDTIPALTQDTKKFGATIDSLTAQTGLLGQKLRTDFVDEFSNGFTDAITGAKSLKDAITGILGDLEKEFIQIIAKNYFQKLFAGPGADGSGGGLLSGLVSFASAAFGGGKAGGGAVEAGVPYRVNEKHGDSEWFVPGVSGSIATANQMGGGNTYNISVPVLAPKGDLSRTTQLQQASRVATALRNANRRNN